MCFIPNWRNRIFLLGNVEELPQKLAAFCFTYQHVDCLHTLFKFLFSGKFVVKSGRVFDTVQRAVPCNELKRGVGRIPNDPEKTIEEKSRKNNSLVPCKRQNQSKPVDLSLPRELNKSKK